MLWRKKHGLRSSVCLLLQSCCSCRPSTKAHDSLYRSVNENADANLLTARQNGDVNYSGSSAVTVYTVSARSNEAFTLVIAPQIYSVIARGSLYSFQFLIYPLLTRWSTHPHSSFLNHSPSLCHRVRQLGCSLLGCSGVEYDRNRITRFSARYDLGWLCLHAG